LPSVSQHIHHTQIILTEWLSIDIDTDKDDENKSQKRNAAFLINLVDHHVLKNKAIRDRSKYSYRKVKYKGVFKVTCGNDAWERVPETRKQNRKSSAKKYFLTVSRSDLRSSSIAITSKLSHLTFSVISDVS
jgi:hypothetical protein